jgi:hypothetical protein
MRAVIVTCLALACLAGGRHISRLGSSDPYPGKWKISLTPGDPGAKPFDEELTFDPNGSQMSTKTLAKHGFGPAAYDEDTRAMGQAKFSCKQTSDTEGKAAWQGYTTGTDLTGTLIWTHKDGTAVTYDFSGSKEQ